MDPRVDEPVHIQWDTQTEIDLLYSMQGFRPIGITRHFQMALIVDRFCAAVKKDVSSKVIWDHLKTMYNMDALHAAEILPFPNEVNDFMLPDEEFGHLMAKYRENSSADPDTIATAPSMAASCSKDGDGASSAGVSRASKDAATHSKKSRRERKRAQRSRGASDKKGSTAGSATPRSPVDGESPAEDSAASQTGDNNATKGRDEGKQARSSRSTSEKQRASAASRTSRSPVDGESPAEDSAASKTGDSRATKGRDERKEDRSSRSAGEKKRPSTARRTSRSPVDGESPAQDSAASQTGDTKASKARDEGKQVRSSRCAGEKQRASAASITSRERDD
ncbi:uncharacterized protein LOC144129610 [Amblyomma americanum]